MQKKENQLIISYDGLIHHDPQPQINPQHQIDPAVEVCQGDSADKNNGFNQTNQQNQASSFYYQLSIEQLMNHNNLNYVDVLQANIIDLDKQSFLNPDVITRSFQSSITLVKNIGNTFLKFDSLQNIILNQIADNKNQALISLNVLQNSPLFQNISQENDSSSTSNQTICMRVNLQKLIPISTFKNNFFKSAKSAKFVQLIQKYLDKPKKQKLRKQPLIKHHIIKTQQTKLQLKNWSIQFFSQTPLIHYLTGSFAPWMIPFSNYDILSYQRLMQRPTYSFILFSKHFQQINIQKICSKVFLNCGQCQIQWLIPKKNDISTQMKCANFQALQKLNEMGEQITKVVQKPKQVVLIPSGNIFSWRVNSKQGGEQNIGILLNWEIMSNHPIQISKLINFQQSRILPSFEYECHDIPTLITDFVCHQYSNKKIRLTLIQVLNYINKVNEEELKALIQVNKLKGSHDQKIVLQYINPLSNKCHNCKKFIYNYYGLKYKKQVQYYFCIQCVKEDSDNKYRICNKYPIEVINKSHLMIREAATSDLDFSKSSISTYEDYCCDGRFIGSTRTTRYCDTNKKNYFVQFKLTHQQKIQKGIQNLKSSLNLNTAEQIMKMLAQKNVQSQDQREAVRVQLNILQTYISKKAKQEILSQYVPAYNQKNCVADMLQALKL